MSDFASQDDFDSLKETVSDLTEQVKTLTDSLEQMKALTDSIEELKTALADVQTKVEKMNTDLYDAVPKFISTQFKLDASSANNCGVLTNDTLLSCPNLQAGVLLYTPPR